MHLPPHPILSETSIFLQAERISVQYGETRALKDVSLQIPTNRVTVLIGPSGCGKSTTLRCINALVKLSSGVITYGDESIQNMNETELRRAMGYAIQSVGLMPHLSVEENVDLVPRLLGWERSGRAERVKRLLNLVRLNPEVYRNKYPHELSGGEAQRVGVARALGADPPVLLMDEPFGAVDPLTREQLQDEFIHIQRQLKKTVIFVTHDIDEAIRLADYLVIMREGEVVQADTPANILASPKDEFVERFLGPDRSLKRLSLFTADHCCIQKVPSGLEEPTKSVLPEDSTSCYWQVDAMGHPIKGFMWVNGRLVSRVVNSASHTVQTYSSLRECMATILSLGLPAAAVVDDEGRLFGEVRFETIQTISIS
ncbi:ABC transporter ATP-binding protein [Sphaerochaeta halotolerans]|jgi:osmoprotectant transport system ATP-binding protein|uniref:ABC transporter ATP-binding protein n=1 Tax=Sphaerochaeta halotolerans TaxID=2293840 RepID=A0A372MFW4_9SPIR|nr:ABC transporter ATP-binding protein [Sphaerochaeta halotolerans]RFU94323.1 ABC transporter ATP-binding protein [Sphaerochaeta halotolerans]